MPPYSDIHGSSGKSDMCHGAEQYRDIDTLADLAVRADVGTAFFSPGLWKRLSRDRNREDLVRQLRLLMVHIPTNLLQIYDIHFQSENAMERSMSLTPWIYIFKYLLLL